MAEMDEATRAAFAAFLEVEAPMDHPTPVDFAHACFLAGVEHGRGQYKCSESLIEGAREAAEAKHAKLLATARPFVELWQEKPYLEDIMLVRWVMDHAAELEALAAAVKEADGDG